MTQPYFVFNQDKNNQLNLERDITFDQVIALIEAGQIVDVVVHPNQTKYPGQKVYILNVNGYCYMVPFVRTGDEIFLKTIIPSRKATRDYLKGDRK